MLKYLFQKDLLAYGSRLTNGKKQKPGTAAALVLVIAAAVFFAVYKLSGIIAETVLSFGDLWLFFAIQGTLGALVGIIGGALSTYTSLYRAEDNNLLMSMPIPASTILASRMIWVYGLGMLYFAIVWVPSVVWTWLNKEITVATVICPTLMLFIVPLFVMVIVCMLGWLVAIIASKIKHKRAVISVLSVLLFAIYYVISFKIEKVGAFFMAHMLQIIHALKTWLYPSYQLGLAASGAPLSFAGITIVNMALAAVCIAILAHGFFNMASAGRTSAKITYREKQTKRSSVANALLRKEMYRFLGSTTYLLNSGIGLLMMLALSVFAVIKAPVIKDFCAQIPADDYAYIMARMPVLLIAAIGLLISMNAISGPSVSLEGKQFWILKTLPVSAKTVLSAKRRLPMLLNGTASAISTILLAYAFLLNLKQTLLLLIGALAYTAFSASLGLTMNLLRPNFDWINENAPIKGSLPQFVTIFGGWILSAAIGVGAFFLRGIAPKVYLIGVIVLLVLLALGQLLWQNTSGAKRFESF